VVHSTCALKSYLFDFLLLIFSGFRTPVPLTVNGAHWNPLVPIYLFFKNEIVEILMNCHEMSCFLDLHRKKVFLLLLFLLPKNAS